MKKLLLASAISMASVAAQAQYAGEVGYLALDLEGIEVGAVYVAGAYEFDTDSDFTSAVELTLGYGVDDDSGIELDSLYSFAYRGSYDFSNGVYAFITPSYAKAEFNVGDTDWEFGIGGGVGYEFSDDVSVELQYDSVDDADIISLGARFGF